MKKCPYCAEEIQEEAIICKHCHSRLDGKNAAGPINQLNTVGTADYKKYIGIALSIVSCIGLFFPVFSIQSVDRLINTVSGYIDFDIKGSLSPIDYIGVFGWIKLFNESNHSLDFASGILGCIYCFFALLELLFIGSVVRSYKALSDDIIKSLEYSKKAIISNLVIYGASLFTVLLYNGILDSHKSSSGYTMDDYFASWIAPSMKMETPVSALVFIVICAISIYLLKKYSDEVLNQKMKKMGKTIEEEEDKEDIRELISIRNSNLKKEKLSDIEKDYSLQDNLRSFKSIQLEQDKDWLCSSCGYNNPASEWYCEKCGAFRVQQSFFH